MPLNYLDDKTLDDCITDRFVLIELYAWPGSFRLKISAPDDVSFLLTYCLEYCTDLQSVFSDTEYSYQSCFAEPGERTLHSRLEAWQGRYPGLWAVWQKGGFEHIMISFPEKQSQPLT